MDTERAAADRRDLSPKVAAAHRAATATESTGVTDSAWLQNAVRARRDVLPDLQLGTFAREVVGAVARRRHRFSG